MPQPAAPKQPASARLHWTQFAAILLGVGLAIMVSGGGAAALWGKAASIFAPQKSSHIPHSDPDLDRQQPQKQAEILMERAVSHSDENADQIETQVEARVDTWRGHLQWDSQLGDLTTVALNSSDESVRASAIEVQLAAYGLSKNDATVDGLVRQADSRDHAKKIWALWALGLLGNRGVQSDRVVRVLASHLKDSGKDIERDQDEDSRRWAVEGLALVGTTQTIEPLLEALHNDASPIVRERAACGLAESGMLSHQQRLIAVPRLINYSDDPALDAQTQAWAFQALADITKQHLPNDSAAWRNWYQTSVASGQ